MALARNPFNEESWHCHYPIASIITGLPRHDNAEIRRAAEADSVGAGRSIGVRKYKIGVLSFQRLKSGRPPELPCRQTRL
ncbi:MAG TPA: hypothetical protein VG056_03110, partial [Pirellulales bacterium]|nr:hypothetical protein [Pirellulales bacterium]